MPYRLNEKSLIKNCKESGVIFDLFGTLVPAYNHHAVLRSMAEALQVDPEAFIHAFVIETRSARESGAYESLNANIREICEAFGVPAHEDRVKEAVEIRRKFNRNALRPREDAEKTITELKSKGYRIGLISDCSADVPGLWLLNPLAPLFDAAVFSCLVRIKKPDLRIYRLALDQLDIQAEQCLFVGDGGSNELQGAERAGMKAVKLYVEEEQAIDPYRPGAAEWNGSVIASLSEILDLIS
jgi:putative hydrolase of the HAD superfamily